MRRVQVFADASSLYSAAAEKICTILETAAKASDRVRFVLTGGTTPRPVYEMMARPPYRERIHWQRIDFFWGDERCVPPDHADSNYRMVRDALLVHVPVETDRVHRIQGELEDREEAALLYEAEIRHEIHGEQVPSFDLVLLGMGEDGHTASLFPGTTWDERRWVVSNFVPKLQSWRITMTPRILNQARHVIFITAGAEKAKALRGVLEDAQLDYPAKRIQPVAGALTWLADKAAASLLSSRVRSD